MWIFRNRRLRQQLVLSALLLLAGTAALSPWGMQAMAAAFGLGAVWAGLWLLWEIRGYAGLRLLGEQLDQILHRGEILELSHFQEGELEILRDEIQKMTIRLKEQSQQLAGEKTALADALADISHQIRTPLTTLNLLMERMKGRELPEEHRRSLQREAEAMLKKIEWLVSALLKMSKLDAGSITMQQERIGMEEFLEEAIKPFEIHMEVHQKTFEIRGDRTLSFVGDYRWTLEAVQNVLKNGIEYTPDGGRLLIECLENPLYTQIQITDSGQGIPKEDLPHLFERFYRGKNAGEQSFGIGLALSRMILSREHGVIRARNAREGGGQFQIRIYKTTV